MVHVKHVGYDECKRLSKSSAIRLERAKIPFVEVDGGAVRWTIYRFQDIEWALFCKSKKLYRNKHRKTYGLNDD